MRNNVNIFLAFFFTISFFIFGWLSHSSYEPVQKRMKFSLLDQIKKEKELRVVLLNSPSTYYIGSNGSQGFEYDLLKSYAKYLGVSLKITTVNTIKEAIEKTSDDSVHIVSASLTKTQEREKKLNFGPSYFEVQQQVICNRNMRGSFPRGIEDLKGLEIRVGEGTSYSETIRSLSRDGFDLNVSYTSKYTTEELLEQVSLHRIDCTVADSNIYALNLRYFPEMDMAFNLSEKEQLGWVFPKNSDELSLDMHKWLNDYNQRGKMAELKDHYYSNVHFFDYYDNKIFYKRIKNRLPKYKKIFEETAATHKIPWKLIAAMAYQESHWNPNATSFTGVRGMMMLTKATAGMLGVEDRVDVNQSINGGTRHIKKMMKLVPKDVKEENRLKFALAAYNVGMGHMHDAQILARRLGYNPNLWCDLKQVLPLLAKKKYYKTLKYGYARGEEPVKYVESIYAYRDILDNYKKYLE